MKIKEWVSRHPRLTAWAVLATGMVIILILSARHVGFEPLQWVAVIITTILLAGACVWIIGWDDEEQEAEEAQAGNKEA